METDKMKTALERIEDLARITRMIRVRVSKRGEAAAARHLLTQALAYDDAAALIRAAAGHEVDRGDDDSFDVIVKTMEDTLRSVDAQLPKAQVEAIVSQVIADGLCDGGGDA